MAVPTPRRRIAFYCQPLSGAGHYVRSREIVRELARQNDVFFFVGGVPVPGADLGSAVRVIALPAMRRTARGIVPLDARLALDDALARRRHLLTRSLRRIRADMLFIEHFPLSKWELRPELLSAIETARSVNPGAQIVSSVRDYPLSNDQACAPDRFREEAVGTLNQYFTHLLVHADPRVARLDTRYSWTSEIQIPIHHTGYVSQKVAGAARPDDASLRSGERGHVLVSSGGLDDGDRLAALSAAAWRLLEARGAAARRRMVIVAGLNTTDARFEALARSLQGGSLVVRGFSPDFLPWMQSADLSISQGGYNTTMNVLETRTRAILAPNRRMIDQTIRAGVMRERGLVDVIDMETITAEQLADRILEALARSRPMHDLSLDGARRTRDLIEVFSAATQASRERAA